VYESKFKGKLGYFRELPVKRRDPRGGSHHNCHFAGRQGDLEWVGVERGGRERKRRVKAGSKGGIAVGVRVGSELSKVHNTVS